MLMASGCFLNSVFANKDAWSEYDEINNSLLLLTESSEALNPDLALLEHAERIGDIKTRAKLSAILEPKFWDLAEEFSALADLYKGVGEILSAEVIREMAEGYEQMAEKLGCCSCIQE